MFHHICLTARYRDGQLRFEVGGANAARDFLRNHGITESDVETVWNAVTLHKPPAISEFMRPEIALVEVGAGMDVAGRATSSSAKPKLRPSSPLFLAKRISSTGLSTFYKGRNTGP
jgi:hypothetical protein